MSAIELAQQSDTSITHFGEAAEWTGVSSTTHREAWLEMRRSLVSASDVAAIMGEDDYRSALDVYADKVLEPEDMHLGLSSPMFWGSILEQPILRAVAKYHGWEYHEGGALLRSRKHPFIGATLDAEINRGDGWIDFEGKTTRISRDWDEESGDLPTRVLLQVQTQLLVTGAPSALVFALLQGSRPCTIEVQPSPKLHRVIVEVSEEFVERLRARKPPPASSRSENALRRLYPRDEASGAAVQLPPEALALTAEYQAISEQLKGLEGRKREIQNLIKQSIGNATFGVLPEPVGNKACWRWQKQEREAYQVAATTSDVLLALKNAPHVPFGCALPPATPVNLLEQKLEASILPSNVTPIKSKPRRRARR